MRRPALVIEAAGPSIVVRALYFICIGWWLGGLAIGLAWFCNATIVGLPLGLYILNRLPTIITLRPQEQEWYLNADGMLRQGKEQYPFLVRAVWFLLFGWWFSGVWLAVAYVALITVIGFPLAFWMFNRVGAVTTLYRS